MTFFVNKRRVNKNLYSSEGQLKWYDPIDHEIPEDVTARVHVEQADSGLRLVVLESRKKDAGVYKCKLLSEVFTFQSLFIFIRSIEDA